MLLNSLSRLNSQLVRAAASNAVPNRCRMKISSRLYTSVARVGLAGATQIGARRSTATQAVAQDTLIIGEAVWNKDLVNCVSIIGNLAGPLEIRVFPTFQVAKGAIAINSGKTKEGVEKPPTWVKIETWGELAHAASSELRKGEKIQILGRMKKDEWTGRDGNKRLDVVVVANQINRIVDSAPNDGNGPYNDPAPWDQSSQAGTPQYEAPQYQAPQYAAYDEDQSVGAPWESGATPAPLQHAPGEEKWVHLKENPDQYYDNRLSKRSEKAPDFKSKDREKDVALWLNGAPQWVHDHYKNIPAPAPYNAN